MKQLPRLPVSDLFGDNISEYNPTFSWNRHVGTLFAELRGPLLKNKRDISFIENAPETLASIVDIWIHNEALHQSTFDWFSGPQLMYDSKTDEFITIDPAEIRRLSEENPLPTFEAVEQEYRDLSILDAFEKLYDSRDPTILYTSKTNSTQPAMQSEAFEFLPCHGIYSLRHYQDAIARGETEIATMFALEAARSLQLHTKYRLLSKSYEEDALQESSVSEQNRNNAKSKFAEYQIFIEENYDPKEWQNRSHAARSITVRLMKAIERGEIVEKSVETSRLVYNHLSKLNKQTAKK